MKIERCAHTEEFQRLLEELTRLTYALERPATFHMKHPFSGVQAEFVEVAAYRNAFDKLRKAAVELEYWWDND